jgi:MFS family permease
LSSPPHRDDAEDSNDGKTIVVSKIAKRSLWLMGLSIVLVLYVHTSLAPALTEMVEFFDTDYAVVSWVLTAYMVSGAASTIVIGKLADMYGAKRMLLLVFVCYTVGTALAGFTHEIYTLLALRVLQGIAVALVPICVRIARELYPKEKFPMAQGVILSMYQAGSAIGLVLGAVVVYFGGWQSVFFSATPFAILFFFLLWKMIPNVVSHAPAAATEPRRQGKVIDIPGVITLILTITSFMLSITFLGGAGETIGLFWIFLIIGIVSIIAFFVIEKRSEAPLINLKLAFHRIIRVGNITYLMLGIVQYIIFSTIPTFAQTQQPYGLGVDTLYVGLIQLPQAIVFVVLGPVAGLLAIKYGNLRFIIPGSIVLTVGLFLVLFYHSTSAEVASTLILFAVGGSFLTLSANVVIYFTPRDSTGVVSATYTTMRIIGGAIGPVIAGVFLSIFTVEVQDPLNASEMLAIPDATAFNITFLVGALASLVMIPMMVIMRRRAISMGMPSNK